MASVHVIDL